MDIFSLLFLRLIPLYLLMGMGFIAARKLNVHGDGVAKILYFLVVPVVFFEGAIHAPLADARVLFLPLIPFSISTLLCFSFYALGKYAFADNTRNLLALSAGNGNIGYFGLPVAMMLFDREGVSLYIILMLGTTLYESTVGYYITARGQYTAREAIRKVVRLPVLYGFALGILLNLAGVKLPEFTQDFFQHLRGSYTVLGMMVIGIGLAGAKGFALDGRFIFLGFLAKFAAYPLAAIALVWLDAHLLGWFGEAAYRSLLLLSLVPMAANTVVIANLLNVKPEKASVAVFLSTMFALVYVPVMVAWLINP